MELYIPDIPETSQLTVELTPTPEEAVALFDELGEFHLAVEQPIEVIVKVQRLERTVRVVGQMDATIAFDCGRCLSHRELPLELDFEFVLVPKQMWAPAADDDDEMELSAEDLDVIPYEGDDLQIDPLIREALVLELPHFAVCPPEIQSSCDDAYEALTNDEFKAEQAESSIDLRWSALLDLKKSMDQD